MKITALAAYRADYDHKTKEYTHYRNQPTSIKIRGEAESYEAAQAFVAQFPKYVKVRCWKSGRFALDVDFFANGVNDGKNEAGIKRINKFLEIVGKDAITMETYVLNAYATLDEFLAAI